MTHTHALRLAAATLTMVGSFGAAQAAATPPAYKVALTVPLGGPMLGTTSASIHPPAASTSATGRRCRWWTDEQVPS